MDVDVDEVEAEVGPDPLIQHEEAVGVDVKSDQLIMDNSALPEANFTNFVF